MYQDRAHGRTYPWTPLRASRHPLAQGPAVPPLVVLCFLYLVLLLFQVLCVVAFPAGLGENSPCRPAEDRHSSMATNRRSSLITFFSLGDRMKIREIDPGTWRKMLSKSTPLHSQDSLLPGRGGTRRSRSRSRLRGGWAVQGAVWVGFDPSSVPLNETVDPEH